MQLLSKYFNTALLPYPTKAFPAEVAIAKKLSALCLQTASELCASAVAEISRSGVSPDLVQRTIDGIGIVTDTSAPGSKCNL